VPAVRFLAAVPYKTHHMKRTVALVLLAAAGFAVAGCGSKKHQVHPGAPPATITLGGPDMTITTVTETTATIPNLKAGTRIACKSLPGILVTAPATGAAVVASRGSRELRLKRLANGAIRVSCTSTH